MLQSRRGFLIGAGSLLTAAFVSDARSFIRRTNQPLLASPEQIVQTLHWYDGGAEPEDGYTLTLGRWTMEPPPAPSWREFFVTQGIAHQTEDEAIEVWSDYAIWPEDYDKPVSERYWWDRWECEDNPSAKAFFLLSTIDLGPGSLSSRIILYNSRHAGSARRLRKSAPSREACRHGVMMDFANDIYVGRSLDTYGEFCEAEMRLLGQTVKPGMTVVEAGANIGTHTVFFAQAVGTSGKVLAFEPQRIIYQMLCGNLALNQLSNVQAINGGLGREAAVLRMPAFDYSAAANFGDAKPSVSEEGETVAIASLDSHELEACHLIKIDVEGMELQVLEGAKNTIARLGPFLYVENDRDEMSKELIQWLLSAGYRLYWHLPPLFSADNFFANPENVFGSLISANMLAVPASSTIEVTRMRQITSPDDSWRSR